MKDIALKIFENPGINITEDGKRHKNYVTQKVNTWLDKLNMLCDIARIEPQAAYSCFANRCKYITS